MRDHAGEDMEQGENSSIVNGRAKLYRHFEHQYGGFSENWELSYLFISLEHIHKECSTIPQGHLLTMFLAALFVIART